MAIDPQELERIRQWYFGQPPEVRQQLIQQVQTGDVTSEDIRGMSQEQPLWRRGLGAAAKGVEVATAPFRWIQEKAIEPFAAAVTAPWSPKVAGTEELPWFQREKAEYKAWKAPRFVKGAVETLPWLAIPSAGQISTGLRGMGIAGRVAAKALTPVVATEALLARAIMWLPSKVVARIKPILSKPAAQRTAAEVAELKAAEELAVKTAPKDIVMPPSTSVQTGLPGMGVTGAQAEMLGEVSGKEAYKLPLTKVPQRAEVIKGQMGLEESKALEDELSGRISQIENLLQTKGRLPTGQGTKVALKGELGLNQAQLEIINLRKTAGNDVELFGKYLTSEIDDIEKEIGLRGLPYHGGGIYGKKAINKFPEFNTEQLGIRRQAFVDTLNAIPEVPPPVEAAAEEISIYHFTKYENINKILTEGFNPDLPPIHGTGGLEAGAKIGKKGKGVLYFTTDKDRWSTAKVYVGEGKGTISGDAYDYKVQKWITQVDAFEKINLEPLEAKLKGSARILEIDSLEAAQGKSGGRFDFVEGLLKYARKNNYDVVHISDPGGKAWEKAGGELTKYGKRSWYDILTGGIGKSDYFILNKESISLIKPKPSAAAGITPKPTLESRNIMWVVKDKQGFFAVQQLPSGKYQLTPSYTATSYPKNMKQQVFNTKDEALAELSKYGEIKQGIIRPDLVTPKPITPAPKIEQPPAPPEPPVTPTGAPPPVVPPSAGAGKFDEIWKDRSQKPVRDWTDTGRKIMEYGDDYYWGLRRLQTQVGKKIAIVAGGAKDLITMLTRSNAAGHIGAARYINAVRELKAVAPEATIKDISNIMDANHYLEVLAKKGAQRQMPKGLNEAELQSILSETKARIGDDAYNAIENVVKTKNKQVLDELVSEGLITKEIGEELGRDYPWYFPLKYVEYLEERGIGAKAAKPLTVITNGLKRLTEEGTVKTAESPLESWGGMFINHEVRIQKNQIARTIIELAQDVELGITKARIVRPVAEVEGKAIFRPYKGDIPGTLSFFKDGVRQVYEVPDWIYREAHVLNKTISNPIINLVGAVNGVSRAAFTSFSPAFVVGNMINDQLAALFRGGVLPWDTVGVLLRSLRGLENDVGWQTFQLAGGYQARFFGREAIKDITKSVKSSGGAIIEAQSVGRKIVSSITGLIPKAGELGEQATRRAFFEKQLNKFVPGWRAMNPEVLAKMPVVRKAAADSVELTINFGRGSYLAKNANPLIIFLNANMEAMKLPFRTLRDIPAARLRLAGMMAGYSGLNTYNMSYPEYFDVPNDVRWGSLMVMLPSKEKDVAGNPKPNYFTVIPRTREWSMFFGSVTYAMEKMYKDSPTGFGKFTQTIAPQFMPFSGLPVAPVIQEIFQRQANWDFYRSQPIVSPETEVLPPEEQVSPWTSRTVAEIVGKFKQSPIMWQHHLQSVLGGAGTATVSVSDYIMNLISPRQVPERIQNLVEQYKNADVAERNRMAASLPAEDREAIYKELRQPEPTTPIISSVTRKVYGPRGGQLYQTGAELAEKQYGISQKQTSKSSQILQKVSDLYLTKQQELDTSVVNNKLNLVDWRSARQDLGKEYQGVLNTIGIMFPGAAQVQKDPKKAFDYYQSLYTLAGAIPDLRMRAQVLAAGWYAIDLNEPEPGTKDWDTFFQMRDDYRNALSNENKRLLDDYLQSRMTPIEKQYTQAQQVLRPYWDIQKKLIANYPELQALYQQIETLDPYRQRELLSRNPKLRRVEEKKTQEREIMRVRSYDIDKTLVEWYGYTPKNPRLMLEKRLR